ncbi:hypothetical protein ACFC8N_23790 [Streptomyces sp. NPDC055966]|uniref:hypothetical protein n=1 Tax=unclassified Streptomyces TaxID=2593676 RepID=UPI0035D6D82D
MLATSVFEDQTGAGESVKEAADFVRDNLAPLLPQPSSGHSRAATQIGGRS